MGCAWDAHGLPVAFQWTARGFLWDAHWLCVGCAWDTHGLLLGHPWAARWIPMGCRWADCGLFLDSPWAARGDWLSVGIRCPLGVRGLPMTCTSDARGLSVLWP